MAGEPVEAEDPIGEVAETELSALNPPKSKPSHHEANKETIGDIVFDVVARTTERRSSTPKITAKVLMTKHRYISLIIDQYPNRKGIPTNQRKI